MVGITSYGAYVPVYRLSRDEIARAWGSRSQGGEKAVANADEDSITMAVDAAIDCMNGIDRQLIDGLYFASTTPPYREKQCGSIVAAALDLRRDLSTADFTNSLRAGTSALRAAVDAVKGGAAKSFLVTASDRRVPAPKSQFEPVFGDGAAAFLIGDSDVAVSIEGSYAISSEFMDMWKTERDTYERTWEDRFILDEGYLKILPEAISELMKKYNLTPKDFSKAIFYAPDARRHQDMARKLGFDPKTQVQDPMFDQLGNTGCAFALMMLVAALEEAKPGERILLASYGDGCDAYILQVTNQIEKIRDRRGIKHHLESKMMLSNYEKYICFRNLMEWETDPRPPDRSALTVLWRERNQIFRFHGSKCKRCGTIQYPIQRVCGACQVRDEYEEIRLSDRKGTIFTFGMDERAMVLDLPNVIAIVDLEGGGRFYCVVTDRDPEKVEVGMPIELTFRNLHDGSGIHNYYWKARPVRC